MSKRSWLTRRVRGLRGEVKRRQMPKSLRLYFHHIPKCGGTSIRLAVHDLFPHHRCVHLNPVHAKAQADLLERGMFQHREHVLAHLLEQHSLLYVSGHFGWSNRVHGLHLTDAPGGWSAFTLLRHPVEKWFSQYFFNRFKQSKHFRIEDELDEFLASDRARVLGRSQVQYLCDRRSYDDKRAACDVKTAAYDSGWRHFVPRILSSTRPRRAIIARRSSQSI